MKQTHIETIIWLRWRLAVNNLKRSGLLNTILTALFTVGAIIISITLFFTSLIVGVKLLPHASPNHILLLWDALVLAFLITWTLGLISELQRSDSLSLDKLLHLPVSLNEAFLCNYLSSFGSLSVIVFVPAMTGLSIALMTLKGTSMLVLFPSIAGFMFMTSALTYQFQGWLATLMKNKRQRNTAVAVITLGLIVVFQLPNTVNIAYQRTSNGTSAADEQRNTSVTRLTDRLNEGLLSPEQYAAAMDQIQHVHALNHAQGQFHARDRLDTAVTLAHILLPIGWLPYGARAGFQGQVWPAILGTIGTFVIALVSLRRSYVTTVLYFTSGSRSGKSKPHRTDPHATRSKRSDRMLLVEQSLPWLSERTSAISFAYLRSLLRAPEAKMLLLTPLIILLVFGALMVSSNQNRISVELRPIMALGTIGMAMFSILQLMQNQFGLDRDGFRNYILAPASRKEVLLGKNMGIAPIALGIGVVALLALQLAMPMNTMHLAASFLQLVSIYLIFSLMGNQVSILLPIRMASGSMRPTRNKPTVIFIQILLLCCFPIALLPSWIPIALELWANKINWYPGAPIYLTLSAVELALMLALYNWTLTRQGRLLQRREQSILQAVTATE